MGQVKEAVKGTPAARHAKDDAGDNLIARVDVLAKETADLAMRKGEDALAEGAAAQPENERKAAVLRSAAGLLRSAKWILEQY